MKVRHNSAGLSQAVAGGTVPDPENLTLKTPLNRICGRKEKGLENNLVTNSTKGTKILQGSIYGLIFKVQVQEVKVESI